MKRFSLFTKEEIERAVKAPVCKTIPLNSENLPVDGVFDEDVKRSLENYRQDFLERIGECKEIDYKTLGLRPSVPYQILYLKSDEKPSFIENYHRAYNDNFVDWEIHHKLETRGFGYSRKELIALGLYYNRPAKELIYLKRNYHIELHKRYNERAKQIKNRLTKNL